MATNDIGTRSQPIVVVDTSLAASMADGSLFSSGLISGQISGDPNAGGVRYTELTLFYDITLSASFGPNDSLRFGIGYSSGQTAFDIRPFGAFLTDVPQVIDGSGVVTALNTIDFRSVFGDSAFGSIVRGEMTFPLLWPRAFIFWGAVGKSITGAPTDIHLQYAFGVPQAQ